MKQNERKLHRRAPMQNKKQLVPKRLSVLNSGIARLLLIRQGYLTVTGRQRSILIDLRNRNLVSNHQPTDRSGIEICEIETPT